MSEYRVQFEVFEGPLDLLLHLVKKQEVDIYQVNLTRIATEFVAYVEQMRELDLEVAGEFLVMAATLLYIKSRELLPVEQQAQVEDDDEEVDDPRWELIRRLVEYKKFKDAAAQLQICEGNRENTYERRPAKLEFTTDAEPSRTAVSVFDLIGAVSLILKRFHARDDIREIDADPYTVSEKIDSLRTLIAERHTLKFSELFAAARSRTEVVVTFLAVLELTRLKQFVLRQEDDFSEIEVSRRPGTNAGGDVADPDGGARSGCSSGGRTRGGGNGSTAAFVIFVPHSALIFVPNFFQMVQQLFFMELKFILESLLIAAPKPLSPGELRDILTRAADEEGAPEHVRACRKLPPEKIEEALATLAAEHEAAARSYRLACVAGAWQFVTLPDFAPFLRAFVGVKNRPAKLSQPALETLAVIAYRQPVTRAECEQIRGVAVDGVITTLKERGLIEEAGRAEVIGRPMQYTTTAAFLEYFGLASLDGLPAADELRRIPVARPESLLTVDAGLATAPPEQLTLADEPAATGETGPAEAVETAATAAPEATAVSEPASPPGHLNSVTAPGKH